MSHFNPPTPPPDRRVLIGTIVKVRGLRGDLKIVPLTWRPERFVDLPGVWAGLAEGEERYLTLKRVRVEQGMIFARFNEAPRRDLAEELVGAELFIDESERDPLPEGRYYLDDLIGCEVVCSRYGNLGTLREVMDLPANDVWIVDGGPKGEVLIPAIKDVVQKIDIAGKKIEVTLLEGLIEEKQAPSGERKSVENDQTEA